MIRVAALLAAAELRRHPGRALATAALLGGAGLLPLVVDWPPGASLALGAAVGWAVALGATALLADQQDTLGVNGATRLVPALAAAGTVAVPGLLATAGALVGHRLGPAGSGPAEVATITVIVPTLVAAVAANHALPTPGPRWPVPVALSFWVVALLLLPLVAVPVLLARSEALLGRWRVGGPLLGIALALGLTRMIGTNDTWSGLSTTLFLAAPFLAAALTLVSRGVLDLATAAAGSLGAFGRLAAAPLRHQRRALAPLAAVLAVISTLAVVDGVVGASFGAREERRRAADTRIEGRAGLAPDQAIVHVFGTDEEIAPVVRAATAGTGLRAVPVDRLGSPTAPPGTGVLPLFVPRGHGIGGPGRGPRWIGVVEPDDLPLLGLAAFRDALASGRVVVLNPQRPPTGEAVEVVGPEGRRLLPAVGPPAGPVATEMPGALVSPRTAVRWFGTVARPDLLVLTAAPGTTADPAVLLQAAEAVRTGLLGDEPDGHPPPFSLPSGADEIDDLLSRAAARTPAVLGGTETTLDTGGPLNDVPLLARAHDQAHDRMLVLGGLALALAVAAVTLTLGATRAEDAVLLLLGAPAGIRVALAAAHAALLGTAGAVVAGAAGLGLPAYAFALYNQHGRQDLPPIPYVLPWEVPVGLVGLPLLAAALAASASALRPALSSSTTWAATR